MISAAWGLGVGGLLAAAFVKGAIGFGFPTVATPLLALATDVILSVPGKRASVFAVPWGEHTYIGTTDTDYDGDLDRPYCTAADVRLLLDALNDSTTVDVVAGGRRRDVGPVSGRCAAAGDAKTADLSRRHRITRSAGGLVTVAGGKLTTWRQMAEDTVDEVLDLLGQRASCRTKELRLRGAAGWDEVAAGPLDDAVRDRLAGRYGAEAATVIGLIADDPSLGVPVVVGVPYVRAEVVYAATHEMATSVDDVLSHRTRARLLARDASADAAPAVAALLAGVLGWSPERERAEVAAYVGEVGRERDALGLTAAPAGDERAPAPGWTPGLRLPPRLAAN